jgi:hypothetical protein
LNPGAPGFKHGFLRTIRQSDAKRMPSFAVAVLNSQAATATGVTVSESAETVRHVRCVKTPLVKNGNIARHGSLDGGLIERRDFPTPSVGLILVSL